MADESSGEQIPVKTERIVGDFLPEVTWIDKNVSVTVVESLPDDAAGDYDWESKQLRISAGKVEKWADDVYQVKRKTTANDFRKKIEQKWTLWDDEAKRSGLMTYLYLRALNRSYDSQEILKRNFETEIVAHEARHVYDDKRGYKEQIGQVGPVEALATLAQLEYSPVYERTLFTFCLEPYWLQRVEGYEPVLLHERVGIAIMKTLLGFVEADNPQVARQSLADKMKYIAFLAPEEFKGLCSEVRGEFEKQLYTTSD